MLVMYIRSSMLSTLEFCEQKCFLNYVIGIKDRQHFKATLGSVTHKALEILARKSLAVHSGLDYVDCEELGKFRLDEIDLYSANKIAFDYYTKFDTDNKFSEKDFWQCISWSQKAISYNNGEFNPLSQRIFKVEEYFDIEIDKPWAYYEYKVDDQLFSGNLRICGTIDLISKVDEHTYRVIDYKGLSLDTKIPTPFGWTSIKDIKVGDVIYDKEGKYTNVIGKSSIFFKECYEVIFDDDTKVICDEDHFWTLNNNSVVSIKNLKVGDEISAPQPLVGPEISFLLSPYEIGEMVRKFSKPIPSICRRMAPCQKLELLRGLLNVTSLPNEISLTYSHQEISLVNSLAETLLSLGYRPSVVTDDCNISVFCSLEGANPYTVKSITPVGKKLTQCLMVDSPTRTFLCTEKMIPTHNTGRRINWATGESKESFEKDHQLLLYYWALKNKYPDKNFYLTLFYINDGGYFDVVFDKYDYIIAENLIRSKFEYIKQIKQPKLLSYDNSHWKCQRLCMYSEKWGDTNKSICQHFHDEINKKGIDQVTNEYADLTKLGQYGDGGGRLR